MAHSHYVIDLYFRTDERSDRLRREVLRIDAKDDDEARAEGQRVDGWRKTHHFDVRAIQSTARAAHRLIYSSPVEDAPVPADEPPVASDSQPSATGEDAPAA